MVDYLGQELNIGDTVVVAISHDRNSGASFTHGVISRFTNCKVGVDGTKTYTGSELGRTLLVNSFKVVKVG